MDLTVMLIVLLSNREKIQLIRETQSVTQLSVKLQPDKKEKLTFRSGRIIERMPSLGRNIPSGLFIKTKDIPPLCHL